MATTAQNATPPASTSAGSEVLKIQVATAVEILKAAGIKHPSLENGTSVADGARQDRHETLHSYFHLTRLFLSFLSSTYQATPFFWDQAVATCLERLFPTETCPDRLEKLHRRLMKICSLLLHVRALVQTGDNRLRLALPPPQAGADEEATAPDSKRLGEEGMASAFSKVRSLDLSNSVQPTKRQKCSKEGDCEPSRGEGEPAEGLDSVTDPMTMKVSGKGNGTTGDRASRNICFLCAKLVQELKRGGPQTREQLATATGFARQRVCTVLSVYKAIGLIQDSKTKRGSIEWSEEQEKLLLNLPTHTATVLQLRSETKVLREKEAELVGRLLLQLRGNHHNLSNNGNGSVLFPPQRAILGLGAEPDAQQSRFQSVGVRKELSVG
jgi:hypothetical protein